MDEQEKFIRTLEAVHQFPGPYTFKLIGDNSEALLTDALSVFSKQLPGIEPDVSRRESQAGNHQSITLLANVPSALKVHEIYSSLKKISGLKMLL